jgi:hypothetical protein
LVSRVAVTIRPVLVVVAPVRLMMVSWLVSTRLSSPMIRGCSTSVGGNHVYWEGLRDREDRPALVVHGAQNRGARGECGERSNEFE